MFFDNRRKNKVRLEGRTVNALASGAMKDSRLRKFTGTASSLIREFEWNHIPIKWDISYGPIGWGEPRK